MNTFAIILVHGTSHAIWAEHVLRKAGLSVKLIPTPRELSSDCGSAVRVAMANRAASLAALERAGVPIDRVELLQR